MAAPEDLDRCSRRESMFAACAAAIVALVHLVIAGAHGALGAARNDDWTYYDIAFHLAETGRVRLDGWTQALFVGQATLAYPVIKLFGSEILPLQCAVAITGAVGLWACYLVVRSILPTLPAALSVACLAVGPLFGSLDTSFMTDVPAFTLQMLTLYFGLRVLRSPANAVRWVTVALAFGLLAFSVREYAVAAGASVAIVAVAVHRRRDTGVAHRLMAVTGIWAALLVALYVWRNTLDHSYATHIELTARGIAGAGRTVGRLAFTLALFVAPAVAVVSPARLVRRAWQSSQAGLLLVAGATIAVALFTRRFVGNYLGQGSSYVVTLPGAAPVVLPTWLWTLLHGIALLSLFMLGALVVVGCADFARNASARRERAFAQPALLLVVVFTALAVVIPVVVAAASDAPIFDRYLLPLVPVTAALALRIGRSAGLLLEPARSVAGVATAALAAVGFMVVDATATVDGAKWQLATNVQSLGFAPATIDGGYEWFGLHQTGIVRPTTLVGEGSPLSNSFGDQTICVVVRHAAAGSRHEPPAADRAPGEPWRAGEIVARYRARSVTGVVYDLEAVATDAGCVPGAGDPT